MSLHSLLKQLTHAALFCLCSFVVVPAQAQHPLDAAGGKALFERNWVAAPASTAAADGLGPLYNARSCNTCHPDGGRGESLQAVTLGIADPVYGSQLQTLALPGLQPEAALQLLYVPAQFEFNTGPVALQRLQVSVDKLSFGPLHSAWSARLAPGLHGLAQLATVSTEELLRLADPEDQDGDGISGRLSLVQHQGSTMTGRFGWKAETVDLDTQVAKAFSLDLGLSSPLFPSAAGDCTQAQADCWQRAMSTTTGESTTELSTEVLNLLLAFLGSLPPPRNSSPEPEGFALFTQTGCAACHVPQLTTNAGAIHPFTDLLLHDLGAELASALELPNANGNEWRTAPLWGLSSSPRYLHDGRADSVEAAILWHGGEAATARDNFRTLSPARKQRLLGFLSTL